MFTRTRVKLLILCLVSSVSWSQSATGTIIGTVSDASGAVLAEAKVTIINQDTNARVVVSANQEGNYTAPLLPAGSYKIEVVAPGFKKYPDHRITTKSADLPASRLPHSSDQPSASAPASVIIRRS